MAKKRLRYIEDLYDFYSNKYKRSTKFSAEKTGEPLVVQVHGRINFDESDKNKDGLLPVHLQSCHTDLNVNGSNIESSVMEAALPSFSNRPILGYIHKVTTDENPEGQWEFYSHNMHEDENGDVVYDEYPIGIIPESCNAQLVYDEEKKKLIVKLMDIFLRNILKLLKFYNVKKNALYQSNCQSENSVMTQSRSS